MINQHHCCLPLAFRAHYHHPASNVTDRFNWIKYIARWVCCWNSIHLLPQNWIGLNIFFLVQLCYHCEGPDPAYRYQVEIKPPFCVSTPRLFRCLYVLYFSTYRNNSAVPFCNWYVYGCANMASNRFLCIGYGMAAPITNIFRWFHSFDAAPCPIHFGNIWLYRTSRYWILLCNIKFLFFTW